MADRRQLDHDHVEGKFVNASLAGYATGRDNNFNLVRFTAATLVLYSHSFAVVMGPGAAVPLKSFIGMTWGMIAVDVFFVISGFLTAGSLFSRKNILSFLWARALRIYPALIAALLFCVLAVGLFFTKLPGPEYLSSPQVRNYFFKNAVLLFGIEHRLPGVFAEAPFKYAVNGSLWTLPYEVKMYGALALIGTFLLFLQARFRVRLLKISFLLIAAAAVSIDLINHFRPLASARFIHPSSMFFLGVAFYVWRDNVRLLPRRFALALAVLALSLVNEDVFFTVYCLSLPYLLLYLAYVPAGAVRRFNLLGDYSYGIYIYAFPVQQSIAVLFPGISVAAMAAVSFGITCVMAFLSWHILEKRCLKLKENTVIEKMFGNIHLGAARGRSTLGSR